MLNFLVSAEENNQTIISFLKRRFKNISLSLIYKLFRTKKIQVNQQNCRYYHYRLKESDQVTIKDKWLQVSSQQISLPLSPNQDINIIYEDENILLVLKDHNQEICKKNNPNCLDNQVQYYLYQENPKKYQQQIQNFFVPVALHRLDKLTRGLVIYPKNITAKKILYNSISDKSKITKTYLAVCENFSTRPMPSFIQGWITKNEVQQKMEFSLQKLINSQAKYCALSAKKLFPMEGESGHFFSSYQLFKIVLETGRKHQIRTILSFFQAPVAGDKKYGSSINLKDQILLFAYQLEFNSLSPPLTYLNKKIFAIEGLENYLLKWLKKKKK